MTSSLPPGVHRSNPRDYIIIESSLDARLQVPRVEPRKLKRHGGAIPFEVIEPLSPIGDEHHIAEYVAALHGAGVDGVVPMPMTDRPLDQIERLSAVRDLVAKDRHELFRRRCSPRDAGRDCTSGRL
jgi:hypothetical protein